MCGMGYSKPVRDNSQCEYKTMTKSNASKAKSARTSAKKSAQKKSQQQKADQMSRNVVVGIGVALLIVVGAFLLLNSGSSSTAAVDAPAVSRLTPAEYQAEFNQADAAHFLLDVRTPEEFFGGHIAGASNIAVETLSSRLSEVPRDVPVVVYCRSGNRSATAARVLRDAGYTQVYDLGGILAWSAAGLPIE